MAKQKFSNNASSKLAGALTNVATSLVVTATEGAKFPILAAGEWFQCTLVKLVGGLPVYEIVRVTARSGDTFTIVRGQESTLATTFSAGDLVDVRPTASGMENMAQQGGDNAYSHSNIYAGSTTFNGTSEFNGVTIVPTKPGTDNSTEAASTAHVKAAITNAGKANAGNNSDITSLSGLTTALSVAQGGTGATAGPAACVNLGAVQQGTGIGQGPNTIKIGWGTGNGLKATVDITDQGYFPFSTTNPTSGTITFSGALAVNNGLTVTGAYTSIQGGSAVTLGSNGYLQMGLSSAANIVMDLNQIQARNNSAASTLFMNLQGGLVQVGSGGLTATGMLTGGTVRADGLLQARSPTVQKIDLSDGATARGFIHADATYCFRTVNAANTLYTFSVDNSGNCTAAGNITANSDESIKTNWRDVVEDFLDHLADVKHGVYDRTDIDLTQGGLSANGVERFFPEAVIYDEHGIRSLNYNAVASIATVKLAQTVRTQRREIAMLKQLVAQILDKLGAA